MLYDARLVESSCFCENSSWSVTLGGGDFLQAEVQLDTERPSIAARSCKQLRSALRSAPRTLRGMYPLAQ
jgi:hypothetical protein